jgi:osmotically-inducible protein OsmY
MVNVESIAPEVETLERVYATLEAEPRTAGVARRITLAFAEGVLTLDGEVDDVSTKTRALRTAAAVPEVRWIVDRLRVAPAEVHGDGDIRDHLRDAFLGDSTFDECTLMVEYDGDEESARSPAEPRGAIRVQVHAGVVTLDGDVPSLSHRRLAGVLAWFHPGTRDVRNRLGVSPPEADSDDEISDAIRIAHEKDPFVDAAQIRVVTESGRVVLRGCVRTDIERRMAEQDAWYVMGVDDVVNEIEVAAPGKT